MNQDPRENRLTEVTAGVLERVDGLAYEVLDAILKSAASATRARLFDTHGSDTEQWSEALARIEVELAAFERLSRPRVHLETQRVTSGGRFVDLELRFRPQPGEPGDEFVFWIEIKHGAGVHDNQLPAYEHDIEFVPADHRRVLVLAPRLEMPDPADVQTMPVIEWQAVGRAIRRWARREHPSEVSRWLVDEYGKYLSEEGLMDEEVLTSEHAFVLAAQPAAFGAVTPVCELADAYVQEHWAARGDFSRRPRTEKAAYGPDYWAHYPRAREPGAEREAWRDSVFEWALKLDTSRDEPRNGWTFVAGLTILSRESPATVADNAEWLADLRQRGFEYLQDSYWRLWRFRYPEELLSESTLDGQGERLGKWVVDAFETLAGHPPPA